MSRRIFQSTLPRAGHLCLTHLRPTSHTHKYTSELVEHFVQQIPGAAVFGEIGLFSGITRPALQRSPQDGLAPVGGQQVMAEGRFGLRLFKQILAG